MPRSKRPTKKERLAKQVQNMFTGRRKFGPALTYHDSKMHLLLNVATSNEDSFDEPDVLAIPLSKALLKRWRQQLTLAATLGKRHGLSAITYSEFHGTYYSADHKEDALGEDDVATPDWNPEHESFDDRIDTDETTVTPTCITLHAITKGGIELSSVIWDRTVDMLRDSVMFALPPALDGTTVTVTQGELP